MDRSAAAAYIYAKAGGMLAKSFVGQNTGKLFSVKSLRELYTLLFGDDVPDVPEVLLAKEIEVRAEKKFISDYISLVKNYTDPDDILVSVLHSFDYDNLKEIGAALSFEEKQMPHVVDIGDFSFLNYRGWPEISKITKNSQVSWYNRVPKIEEQKDFDTKLDEEYIKEVWNSVQKLSGEERKAVEKLIFESISHRNIIWVLRLKVFYKMPSEEIQKKLAYACLPARKNDVLAREAIKILEKDIGNWDDWKEWKHADCLNPHEDGVVWEIDPCWVENAFKNKLAKLAIHSFHKNPMSVLSLVSWFKIKQNELDCIRTVAEGLRLDVESGKVMEAAGIVNPAFEK